MGHRVSSGSSGCPDAAPDFGGKDTCTEPNKSCSYGTECCCGDCYASYLCSCQSGFWSCYYSDACYVPPCGGNTTSTSSGQGAGGSGGQGNAGAGQGGSGG